MHTPRSSLILTILLCACTVKAPKNDSGYANVDSLASLNGCYENRSEAQHGPAPNLLASKIWRNMDFGKNKVHAVRVLAIENSALRVAAIEAHRIVREDTFVKDKDFTFESGVVTISGSSDSFGSTASQPGSVFIGGGISSTTLGVDKSGNGRSVNSATLAGTVFLVVPVAGKFNEVDRFRKSPELCVVK